MIPAVAALLIGVALLILGFLLAIKLLWIIGVVVLAVAVVVALLGLIRGHSTTHRY